MNASDATERSVSPAIDLNADLGEGCSNDRALLGLVTSASICCGAHAGSRAAIRRTVRDAIELQVVVGAHPGYADREGFGRREQNLTSAQVVTLIQEQVAFLADLAREAGASIRFLKPHGALYNQAQREEAIARGVVAAAVTLGLPVLGQPDSLVEKLCALCGLRYVPEGFPDRRYRDDGSLVPRSEPHAIIVVRDEFESQVLRLAAARRVATLCIHGDDPRAVANAQLARSILGDYKIAVRSFINNSK
jgi:UPF0271 protein